MTNTLTDLYDKIVNNKSLKITETTHGEANKLLRGFVAKNKDKGVIVWASTMLSRNQDRTIYEIKLRTTGSGYRLYRRAHLANVDKAFQEIVDVLNGDRRKCLRPGWAFSYERYTLDGVRVHANLTIAYAKVMKFVTIGDDGRIIEDIYTDNDCWYLLDCASHLGATFNIISDGEVFYPVSRITDSTKVVKIMGSAGKASVDLRRASTLDQELVNKAIELYHKSL